MTWPKLGMLRQLDEQLKRIPQTPLGELAKTVLLNELSALGQHHAEHLSLYGHFQRRKSGPVRRGPIKVTVECYHCEEVLNASQFPLCEVRNALIGKAATCTQCRDKQSRKTEVETLKTA